MTETTDHILAKTYLEHFGVHTFCCDEGIFQYKLIKQKKDSDCFIADLTLITLNLEHRKMGKLVSILDGRFIPHFSEKVKVSHLSATVIIEDFTKEYTLWELLTAGFTIVKLDVGKIQLVKEIKKWDGGETSNP